MEYIFSILSGSLSSAVLVWLAKGWISERLKQSIQHEYAEKLESYKTELNSKVEGNKPTRIIINKCQRRKKLFILIPFFATSKIGGSNIRND